MSLTALLMTVTLGAAGAMAADDPTAANPMITDAITQSNVKVLGDSPAMAMGTLYSSLAQSIGTAASIAQTPSSQGYAVVHALDMNVSAPTSRQGSSLLWLHKFRSGTRSGATAEDRIQAIAERLDECGADCIVNIHAHVDPRRAYQSQGSLACSYVDGDLGDPLDERPAESLVTCIVAEFLEHLDRSVPGVGLIVPDGARAGQGPVVTQAPGDPTSWRTAPVTSVDIYVMRPASDS